MLKVLQARFQQKHRTMPFPSEKTQPLDRFRGFPKCDFSTCRNACLSCLANCPTGALVRERGALTIDMGKCIFCGECERSCSSGKIKFTNNYSISSRKRTDLILVDDSIKPKMESLDHKLKSLFGRSLKLRQVSAGGCNACEADTNVLNTVGFDLGRFGIQFVASPRHADGILVTGPVSKNMRLALEKTYASVPSPKLVIATGTCAISGGIFAGFEDVCNGTDPILPVDLYIPGCPPHPLTILDGMLGLLGRL